MKNDIKNLSDLSEGEHSLEEVMGLASEGRCPECGGNLRMEYRSLSTWDYCKTWECIGCGATYSE